MNQPPQISELDRFRHDLEKPRAVIRMFFNLYRETGATSEQCKEWEKFIDKAFRKISASLKSEV